MGGERCDIPSGDGLTVTRFSEMAALVPPRDRCAHKGCFGRGLLVAGSLGMAGASVLAAGGALRSGIGLLTLHVPRCNNVIVQTSVPEAMTLLDADDARITVAPDCTRYTAVATGPGIGRDEKTATALLHTVERCTVPMVLDADALNIISEHKEWLRSLPRGSVITPHQGEFERLFGKTDSLRSAREKAREMAAEYNLFIVLKGADTLVCSPDGDAFLNSTGNPGMATGGSGDVLTGIMLALLARGCHSLDAARLAVFVHGLAGDFAAAALGETAMTSGDIVRNLPAAWRALEQNDERLVAARLIVSLP